MKPETAERLAELRRRWWAGDHRRAEVHAAELGMTTGQARIMWWRHGPGPDPVAAIVAETFPVRREPAPGEGCSVRGGCEWPVSDGRPWWFCVEKRRPGSVYCTAHHAIAFNKRPGGAGA